MERLRKNIRPPTKNIFYIACLLVLASVFLYQAFYFAHSLPSRVDEGSFMIKGYYFVSGEYRPFEDYGPWTNNMPLAYLIPGIPQVLFGPGLRTGRYFAAFCAALTLVGVWLVISRLTNRWWALAGVAAFAVNPAWVATNVQAVSQPLAACLTTWMLVLLFGEKRSNLHIAGAAVLSAAATLTRQNMVFLMPFVVLFVWWRDGFKRALLAFTCAAAPFITVHAIYYPKIMQLWYSWFPKGLKNILGVGTVGGGGKQVWRPDGTTIDRITAFFLATRYYFLIAAGFLLPFPFAIQKKKWQNEEDWKRAISLTILFTFMTILHGWASLTKNYCIFCFPNYLAFFIPSGLLLAVLLLHNVFTRKIRIPILFQIVLLLAMCAGVFLASRETVGRLLLDMKVPRIRAGRFVGGVTEVWELFRNRFGWEYDRSLLLLPPVFGALFLVVWVIFNALFCKLFNKKLWQVLLVSTLILGLVLTPTNLLGGYSAENPCGGDVIAAYELLGAQLKERVPAGASVYWGAGSIVTPMVYITDRGIQPLQLNGVYPKRIGGDRDALERSGYYNQESIRDWMDSSEFILLQIKNINETWAQYLNPEDFDEYAPTGPIDPCDPNTSIQIYRRKAE